MSGRGAPKYGDNKHKNVTLRSPLVNGFKTYKLVGPDGDEIDAFNTFQRSITKLKHHTQKNYSHHIADAYDYLFEGSYHMANRNGSSGITSAQLKLLLEAWEDYLVDGANSQNETAVLVAQTLPSPMISANSATVKLAALRRLLGLSERIRAEQESFVKLGLLKHAVDLDILYPHINRAVEIDRFERRKMIEASVVGGVIAGGPKKKAAIVLQSNTISKTLLDVSKTFPFDKVADLIKNCSSNRDKALFSLYAASGCRQHEGLQLLWIDIDARRREVKLVDPRKRIDPDAAYAGLTNSERRILAWKARTTSSTFLIEPFASMFFEYLEQYVRHEYIAHGEHGFIFQHLRRGFAGRPYFLSTPKTRSEAFHKAARGLALPPEVDGPHTLRHMYGTYLLNYFPNPDGHYGKPIEDVSRWMGHSSIKDTQRYAIKDIQLQRATLSWGNAHVFENGSPKTLIDLKIEALAAQIEQFELQRGLMLKDHNVDKSNN